MSWSKLVDLELSDDEKLDTIMPLPMSRPDYPCGTRIVLCDSELEKLGLDMDCDEGDMIDLRAFGVVTSVHKEAGNNRVEIQLQKMAVENEMTEKE
jgi:hypothetical protein